MSTTGSRVSQPSKARPDEPRVDLWATPPALADRAGDVGGPVITSPAANSARTAVWQWLGSTARRPAGRTATSAANAARVGLHPDGGDDHVASDGHRAAGDGLRGLRRPDASGAPSRIRCSGAPLTAPVAVATHLGRGDEQLETAALLLGVADSRRGAPASRRGCGGRRPCTLAAPRRRRHAGRVHRDVAATDHDDPLAGEVEVGSPRLTWRRKSSPLTAPRRSSPGTSIRVATVGAGGDDDGVVAVVLQGGGVG